MLDIPIKNTRRSAAMNPTTETTVRAMQFALTEYICVSSEEDGPPGDAIHACSFDFFHKQVILTIFFPI